MEERIYNLRLELTDEELGITMRALTIYANDWRCISEGTYDIIQKVLGKLEEAM